MLDRRPRIALLLNLQWPYKRHTGVFAGTQRYAQEQGWESIIDEYAAENLAQDRPGKARYDGVIARANSRLADRAERLGVPVVNVWLTSPVWRRLPGVFPDFVASGRLRAEHLLARGLRRFAIMEREDRGAKTEATAFRERVSEAGFECMGVKLPLDPTRTYAAQVRSERKIEQWMERWEPPIGVFVSGDTMGRLVAQMAQRRGYRVPQDVAIIAGANEEAICEHPRPSLTSIEFGHDRIGYEAARMLDQLMASKDKRRGAARVAPTRLFLPPLGVVVRESTDFVAVDDVLVADALAYIAANCHRRMGQADVARAVSTESRTLQRRFQKVLGRPIAATIRQARLERAKRELVQSERPLDQIARSAGFSHAMRMYDVFRRELGISPSDYRKQRRQVVGKRAT